MADTAYKYVTYDNLNHFVVVEHEWITKRIPTKTSDITNDSNYVSDASYVHTDNNYSADEKNKLAGVEAGANKTTVTTTISQTDGNPVASSAVALALEGKVDKVDGKTLTTNDLTNDLKKTYDDTVTKVASLVATGVEANVIETVKVNGTALTPDDSKAVNVVVPTDNASIANGAGYQTAANVKSTVEGYGYQTAAQVTSAITSKGYQTAANVKSTVEGYGYQTAAQVDTAITAKGYQTKDDVDSEIAAKLSGITGITFKKVDTLPTSGDAGTIYLVAHSHGTNDSYDEYIYTDSAWEKLGNTDIDTTNFVLKSELVAITNTEIDNMVNG